MLMKKEMDQIWSMKDEGYKQSEIAKTIGCSQLTVMRALGKSPPSVELRRQKRIDECWPEMAEDIRCPSCGTSWNFGWARGEKEGKIVCESCGYKRWYARPRQKAPASPSVDGEMVSKGADGNAVDAKTSK